MGISVIGGEFPPGFEPTAFWFFPDWGDEDQGSRHGFKEPFWMKEAKKPENKEQKVTRRPEEAPRHGEIAPITHDGTHNGYGIKFFAKCGRNITDQHARGNYSLICEGCDCWHGRKVDLTYNNSTHLWIQRLTCLYCGSKDQISWHKWDLEAGKPEEYAKYHCPNCKLRQKQDAWEHEKARLMAEDAKNKRIQYIEPKEEHKYKEKEPEKSPWK